MRIVAISDQHGFLPEVPPCDLLIVAGDICPDVIEGGRLARDFPDSQKSWFDAVARPWLAAAPATHKILTWGNHDWCGNAMQFTAEAPGGVGSTRGQIIVDSSTTIPSPGSPAGAIIVWATPWSNRFMDWTFMKTRTELAQLYAAIPDGLDI